MKVNFEVSAKAARLIGRENIADVDGALSELIKNAYDADASCVYVDFFMPFPDVPSQTTPDRFASYLSPSDYKKVLEYYVLESTHLHRRKDLTETEKGDLQRILFSYNKIIVADNGEGMNLDIVCSSWMQIATSTKETRVMSKKGRVKTGAKGIGRFALDKLSEQSVMYTKAPNSETLRWAVDRKNRPDPLAGGGTSEIVGNIVCFYDNNGTIGKTFFSDSNEEEEIILSSGKTYRIEIKSMSNGSKDAMYLGNCAMFYFEDRCCEIAYVGEKEDRPIYEIEIISESDFDLTVEVNGFRQNIGIRVQ